MSTGLSFSLESADPQGFWENVYGLFRDCHLPGLFLLGQLDPGCGHHGLQGVEPGNHR